MCKRKREARGGRGAGQERTREEPEIEKTERQRDKGTI